MKESIPAILIAVAILFASCHKSGANISNGGSWTIKGSTYNADSCVYYSAGSSNPGELVAQTGLNPNNPNTYSQLYIEFGAPPIASSTYALVNDSMLYGTLSANQAVMTVTTGLLGGIEYGSIGSGSIAVTISPTGKVSVSSGPGVEMQNMNSPLDSTRLVFNVAQTN